MQRLKHPAPGTPTNRSLLLQFLQKYPLFTCPIPAIAMPLPILLSLPLQGVLIAQQRRRRNHGTQIFLRRRASEGKPRFSHKQRFRGHTDHGTSDQGKSSQIRNYTSSVQQFNFAMMRAALISSSPISFNTILHALRDSLQKYLDTKTHAANKTIRPKRPSICMCMCVCFQKNQKNRYIKTVTGRE